MGVMCGSDNLCINMHTPNVAATSFFIHRTEIFDFVVRWDKKVYRRKEVWGMVNILFKHSVVGNNIYFMYTKMGVAMWCDVTAVYMNIYEYIICTMLRMEMGWFGFLFFGLFLYKTIEFTVASGHIPTHKIWVYKWGWCVGVILYRHNVVGGGVNCTNDIYGGRTHSAYRYVCEHRHIQL